MAKPNLWVKWGKDVITINFLTPQRLLFITVAILKTDLHFAICKILVLLKGH